MAFAYQRASKCVIGIYNFYGDPKNEKNNLEFMQQNDKTAANFCLK